MGYALAAELRRRASRGKNVQKGEAVAESAQNEAEDGTLICVGAQKTRAILQVVGCAGAPARPSCGEGAACGAATGFSGR